MEQTLDFYLADVIKHNHAELTTLIVDIDNLKNRYELIEFWQSVGSGTTGTLEVARQDGTGNLTPGTEYTIYTDAYPGAVDALLTTLDGVPKDQSPVNSAGRYLTVALSGATNRTYTFVDNGGADLVPTAYPVAVVFFILIKSQYAALIRRANIVQRLQLQDHALQNNLTFATSGHTGFQAQLTNSDVDIQDAVTKRHSNSLDHTQGTDQGLDTGGANAVTAAQAKSAYTHSTGTNLNKHGNAADALLEAYLNLTVGRNGAVGGLVGIINFLDGNNPGATTALTYAIAKSIVDAAPTATPTASKIPIANASGYLNAWTPIRVTEITTSNQPTFAVASCDMVSITALAADINTMTTNMDNTGAYNGQKLTVRIKDNATPRNIDWGGNFTAGGVALPLVTVTSKILTVGFIYNTANALNKWCCVALSQEV